MNTGKGRVMKLKNFRLKSQILALAAIVVVILAALSAFTLFKPLLWTDQTPEIDLSAIGIKTAPTTDPEILRQVIEQINQIQPQYGPGWVHWTMSSYQLPPDQPDPLFSKDGYHTKEFWYYVNRAGVYEKSLVTTRDSAGNILQESACGDSVCGNISLIGLEEFKDQRLANPFSPIPFKLNSASSLLMEIAVANAEVKGWVESSEEGDILYISAYHGNQNNELIQNLTPEFEGTQVVLGVYVTSGELAFYSTSKKIGGQFSLHTRDTTILLELVKDNSIVEARIAEITQALLERDRELYGK